jgi:hypothetical protein
MSVLHIIHSTGGGSLKYLEDLMKLTGKPHTLYHGKDSPVVFDEYLNLVHVHSFFPYEELGWNCMQILRYLKHFTPGLKIFVTIHDYYWLFENSNGTLDLATQGFTTEHYTVLDKKPVAYLSFCTWDLFKMADKVIMPSQSVYDNYRMFMGSKYFDSCPIEVVPHCDMDIRYEQLYVPQVKEKVNVAIVSCKGLEVYKIIKEKIPSDLPVQFIEYPTYKDEELIETLHRDNIHIILWPSRLEETYCYALSRLINSGIPIVYIRRGAFANRLPEGGRFFGTTDVYKIIPTLYNAINFVMSNQGKKDYIKMDETVKLNDWYKENY